MHEQPTLPTGQDVAKVARDLLADSAPRLIRIGLQRVHSIEVSGDTDLGWYDEPVYGPNPEDVVA